MAIKPLPKLYNDAYYRRLKDNTRVQIYFGGASSGRSYFVAQRIVLDTLAGRNTLVLRNVARTLRGSCWNEVIKAINALKPILRDCFNVSKSEMLITAMNNGAQILFAGLMTWKKSSPSPPRTAFSPTSG